MTSLLKATISRFSLLLTTALFITATCIKAQSKINHVIIIPVEKSARFPGGFSKLSEYLSRNLHYPARAEAAKVEGKVFITFAVEKDGSISDIKVMRGIGYGCDEEAVRVMKASPKWIPAKQKGQAVRSQFTLPISFTLNKH